MSSHRRGEGNGQVPPEGKSHVSRVAAMWSTRCPEAGGLEDCGSPAETRRVFALADHERLPKTEGPRGDTRSGLLEAGGEKRQGGGRALLPGPQTRDKRREKGGPRRQRRDKRTRGAQTPRPKHCGTCVIGSVSCGWDFWCTQEKDINWGNLVQVEAAGLQRFSFLVFKMKSWVNREDLTCPKKCCDSLIE